MSSPGGQIGNGVRIGYSENLVTPDWVEIPQVMESTPPQLERDQVETTVHGVDGIRTYIPGLATPSDCEFTLLADLGTDSVHKDVIALERNQTPILIRYEIPIDPDLSTTQYVHMQFTARLKKAALTTPIDGTKDIECAATVSGNYDFSTTAAASAFD